MGVISMDEKILEKLKEKVMSITLTQWEYGKYGGNPRQLARDVYGDENLYKIILHVNNMKSEDEFVKSGSKEDRTILVLKKADLDKIINEQEFVLPTVKLTKAKKFRAIVGINPGYNDITEGDCSKCALDKEHHECYTAGKCIKALSPIETVAAVWHPTAQQLFDDMGIYISAVLTECKTIYSKDWGCPISREVTVEITGVQNPVFLQDSQKYIEAASFIISVVKATLEQSTVTVEYSDVEIECKTDDKVVK